MKCWVIEKRDADGTLDLTKPQPESVFGMKAITGISEDAMSQRIFQAFPDASLTGTNIASWPSVFNASFIARVKTW